MKKMGADSLPELVRMAEKIGIPGSERQVQTDKPSLNSPLLK
jgi:hypothetical protein